MQLPVFVIESLEQARVVPMGLCGRCLAIFEEMIISSMKNLSFGLFLAFMFCLRVDAKPKIKIDRYPVVRDVAHAFFASYTPLKADPEVFFSFEKRPDGFWVCESRYSDESIVSRKLFWSYQKKKYLKLDYPVNEGVFNTELFEGVMARTFEYSFKSCIFYGYIGWQQDVIRHFNPDDDLSDAELYALGRTYSLLASDLLNDNSGFSDPMTRFQLGQKGKGLTPVQLAEYRKYRHRAIALYEDLADRNPDFKTLVGSITLKLGHEYLTSFLDILTFHNEEEALKELKRDLYSPFFTAMAKNYLESCDQGAILFVNGDTDTYPLYYLQAQYGIRTDVTVINLSLLNTLPYIRLVKSSLFGETPPVQTSIPDEAFTDDKRRILASYNGNPQDTLRLDSFVAACISANSVLHQNGYTHYLTPMGNLKFGEGAVFNLPADHILRNDLVLYDIIASNFGNRPIYFASTIGKRGFAGLTNFVQLEGLAMKLGTKRVWNSQDIGFIQNPSLLYKRLTRDFDWTGLETTQEVNYVNAQNYRHGFTRLAGHYFLHAQKDSAKLVLDKCLELLPAEIIPYQGYTQLMIWTLYQLKDPDKAALVARSGVKRYADLLEGDTMKSGYDYADYYRQSVSRIIGEVEANGDLDLVKELEGIIGQ